MADEYKINGLIEQIVNFRGTVRNRALEQDVKDKVLLTACDKIRSKLSTFGVIIKVQFLINLTLKSYISRSANYDVGLVFRIPQMKLLGVLKNIELK